MICRSAVCDPHALTSWAHLQIDNPLLMHHLEVVALLGLFGIWIVRGQHQPSALSWPLFAMAAFGTFAALWVQTRRRRVRVSLDAGSLRLRAFATSLWVTAASVARLGIDHHPCRMRIVLCDGRVLRIDDVDARLAWAFEARVARARGPETFKLAGIPRLGRLSGWLSAIPLLSGSVRPTLRLLSESLELRWGPFQLRRPLCQLTQAVATVKGVRLSFTDETKMELFTYGGLGLSRLWTTFELNRILEERLNSAKQRALARALSGYRKRFTTEARDND